MADLKKGARTTRLTGDKLATDVRSMYEKGQSIRAIAKKYGRSYGFVHRILTEAGVTIRGSRGGARAKIGENEPREAAHRLLDEVPAERVPAVVELLRREAAAVPSVPRRFRTIGVFSGEADLGERSKEIVRQELSGKSDKSA